MGSPSATSEKGTLADNNDFAKPDTITSGHKNAGSKSNSKTASNVKKRKSIKRDDLNDSEVSQSKRSKTNQGSSSKKKVKKETKVKKESGSKSKATSAAAPKLKKLEKADRIFHAMQSFSWWESQDPPEGCQWQTMEHAGVSFTEPYVPHGVKMKYDGVEVDLNPVEEEA
jgi:DNA topoisomerase-1